MRYWLFIIALLLTPRAFSQTDSAEVVFAVKKAEQHVTPSLPAYYYASTGCEAEEDTTTYLRVVLKSDTLIFSVIESKEEYYVKDSLQVKVTFKETGRLRIAKNNEGIWYSELYKDDSESGDLPFVSLNTKVKTPDAFNLLCPFEIKRNCRQQHNMQFTTAVNLQVNGRSVKCLKVVGEGSKTKRGKVYKGEESSLAFFKTRITYFIEETTGMPIVIKEESAERSYPYCHTWFVTDITQ